MIPKFRVFECVTNIMWQSHEIDVCFRQDELYIDVPRGKNRAIYFGKSLNRITLMQSTGLFDKNGVEIFEGDIVNIHWFYFDGGGESEVQLHRKEILNYKGVLCFEWQYDYCPLALGNWHEESFEVVGNIYENQEFEEVEE